MSEQPIDLVLDDVPVTEIPDEFLIYMEAGGDKRAAAELTRRAKQDLYGDDLPPVTAAGDSWRWQLRDADGQWIEMGSEVKWLVKGLLKHGTVVGSPSPGVATVRERDTGQERDMPSSRLEVADSVTTKKPLAKKAAARRPKATVPVGPSEDFWGKVLEEPKPGEPVPVSIRSIKPGDVIRSGDGTARQLVVAKKSLLMSGEKIMLQAVNLDGPRAGRFKEDFLDADLTQIDRYEGEVAPTFAATLDGIYDRLEALKTEYPKGVAAALDQVLSVPQAPITDLEMSPDLKERLKDAAYVRWTYEMGRLGDRLAQAMTEASPDFDLVTRLHKEYQELEAGKGYAAYVTETERLLKEYQAANLANTTKQLEQRRADIRPRDPAAVKILDDVMDIGRDVRVAVDVETARRGAGRDRLAKGQVRREVTREALDNLVGMGTSTSQTWPDAADPGDRGDTRYLRPLDAKEKEALTAALLTYPDSWVRRFDAADLSTSLSTRGYYYENDDYLTVSDPHNAGPYDGGPMRGVMIHEIGHGMERTVPGISDLERVFWHSRIDPGEGGAIQMRPEDGGYYPDDSAVRRKTPLRYTMKTYGSPYRRQRYWEAFTTGVKDVLNGGTGDTYDKDGSADLWDMTMGALVTLQPGAPTPTGEGATTDAADSVASPA